MAASAWPQCCKKTGEHLLEEKGEHMLGFFYPVLGWPKHQIFHKFFLLFLFFNWRYLFVLLSSQLPSPAWSSRQPQLPTMQLCSFDVLSLLWIKSLWWCSRSFWLIFFHEMRPLNWDFFHFRSFLWGHWAPSLGQGWRVGVLPSGLGRDGFPANMSF